MSTKTNAGLALDFATLRTQIVGSDAAIETPFGERLMVYADYTASGRCLAFVEQYLQELQCIYANTHTEDDISGRSMTHLLEQAEQSIKRSVNAGPHGCIVPIGSGATGAIDKFQQIIGVMIPPATHRQLWQLIGDAIGSEQCQLAQEYLQQHQPVVFVGPYEHHSNEVSWRHGLATVVEAPLAADGSVDLAALEQLLQAPEYRGRLRIGSFSAASNVTGMKSPVHEIAALLHRYDAIACFDYAASAPYVDIDMNPPDGLYAGDASLDAVFISPHKFLGGPGSTGVLVFNRRLYQQELPPTVAAGGTVDYVGPTSQDFIRDIEQREKAGTPGVLQILKAGLAFQLKDAIGPAAIEGREHELLLRLFTRWQQHPLIEILGNPDPDRRIGIVSFNLRDTHDKYLHPKFVTTLLNDLFGIQSRAGCSCAGPYGHRLLDIDEEISEKYRHFIRQGYSGIKPGWCRVSLHYAMDDIEVDYIAEAVEFVAEQGHCFLPLYAFDLCSGAWTHRQDEISLRSFSLTAALECVTCANPTPLSVAERMDRYQAYLAEARQLSNQLAGNRHLPESALPGELDRLRFFSLPQACMKSD